MFIENEVILTVIVACIYGILIASSLSWVISFFHDRRKLINGFLFIVSYFSTTVLLIFGGELLQSHTSFLGTMLMSLGIILLILPFLLFPIFVFIMIASFFSTGFILVRREGVSKSHLLSFAVGLMLIIWTVLFLFDVRQFPWMVQLIFGLITFGISYFFFQFLIFIVSMMTYFLRREKYQNDYIIVLGAGLNGDQVTPLLASRINRAISLYQRQLNRGYQSKLIMSGGQGVDEVVPESHAMRNYALQVGVDAGDIIVEDQSINTYQNLKYSKALMDFDAKDKSYKSVLSTNRYHVFRALLLAKTLGMETDGIGAKTKLYYSLNALVREFIAVLVMHKWFHLFMVLSISILITCVITLQHM